MIKLIHFFLLITFVISCKNNEKNKEISSINDSENDSIEFPKIEEQIKISRYLDNLDNLIILHQRKLEKLQNLKKAFLEKMFV